MKSGLWIRHRNPKLDQRTRKAKEEKRLRDDLIAHVGGSPSIVEQILIQDVIFLYRMAQDYDNCLLLDKTIGSRDRRLAISGAIRRHCGQLGIKAVRPTISLEQYLKQKEKAKEEV